MKTSFVKLRVSTAVFAAFLTLIAILITINLKTSLTTVQKVVNQQNKDRIGMITWGSNSNGQLGIDFASSQDPLLIEIKNIKTFSAGQNHSLTLTKSGQVLSWGNNHYGQLGFPTQKLYISTPTSLQGFNDAKEIAVNSNHSLILRNDGSVWAFGNNFTGQLGNGTNINSSTPIPVPNVNHVRQIAAGYKFSLAIKDDYTIWAWGTSCDPNNKDQAKQLLQAFANNLAALQNGYYDSGSADVSRANQNEDCLNEDIIGIKSKTPKQITGLDRVNSVSGGYGHVLALKDDATVWTFGCNHYGQLGQGENARGIANATPRQLQGLPPIDMVSAGFRHSLVLTKDGEVYAWGHNQFGELGQGQTSDDVYTPTKVEGLNDVAFIAAGFDYSLSIKKDGTLWGWGTNNFKQLGKDEAVLVTKPIQIKGVQKVNYVSTGGAHVLALTQ